MKREDLINHAITYEGNWEKIATAVKYNHASIPWQLKDEAVTILDKAYPDALKKLRYPPWVLFYEGNLNLLQTDMVTIIGSRKISEYGKKVTESIANTLKERYTLVSGLARGVDGTVHACCFSNGHTIGVIGSGLGTHYPRCNEFLYQSMRTSHLILSEYPHDTGVRKEHFPWRNRILAALGKAVIVTEAEVKSGTALTVNEALALSKDVYAVPHPYEGEHISGCNRLIYDGAIMLYGKEQLMDL